MPARAASDGGERWFVVLDGDGAPVSEGTVLADPLPDGLTVVAVDGPAVGRPWDRDAQAWGPRPAPAAPVVPAEQVLAELGVIAADESKTQDQRIGEILAALAAAASTT